MLVIMFMLVMFGIFVCLTQLDTLSVMSELSYLYTVPVRFYAVESPDIYLGCFTPVIDVSRYWLTLETQRLRYWLMTPAYRELLVPRPHRLFIPDPPLRPP